jgi:AcrR family transcriptional regulator
MASKILPRILEAAIEIFAERGYSGATTSEIAQRAEVTEHSVFRLFASKDNLFRESLRTVVNRTLDPIHFESLVARGPGGRELEFPAAILGGVRRWYSSLSTETARLLVYATLDTRNEWREIAHERTNRIIEILGGRIEGEARRLKVRKLNSHAAAQSLIFTLIYFRVARPVLDTREKQGELVETVVQQWIHGLFAG